jgi:hypothetical protein
LPDHFDDRLKGFIWVVKEDVALPRRGQNVGVSFRGNRISGLKRGRLEVRTSDSSDLPQPSKVCNGARAVYRTVGNTKLTSEIGEHVRGHAAVRYERSDRIVLTQAKHSQRAVESANAGISVW